MKNLITLTAALALCAPALAQEEPAPETQAAPSPNQIVDTAPIEEWISIPAEDLLVMTLAPDEGAPDREGNARQVVMQLMPAPFSQGWVENIRTLARAGWYDGISVNRVQDNYVVQWGDANVEDEAKAKKLPEGLWVMDEREYVLSELNENLRNQLAALFERVENHEPGDFNKLTANRPGEVSVLDFPFGLVGVFDQGFPFSLQLEQHFASFASPIHCYGMVGVGRGYSPDTGSGAELYTVIGHAPRHLDRNIALVGRVIEGIEHLSSLPRGTGPLGFYENAEERVPIQSIRVASDLETAAQPAFEYLSTESESFARYADARANRRDPFFIVPAGGADICNIPVHVRRVAEEE